MKNETRIKHQMLLGVNLAKEVKDVYSENQKRQAKIMKMTEIYGKLSCVHRLK